MSETNENKKSFWKKIKDSNPLMWALILGLMAPTSAFIGYKIKDIVESVAELPSQKRTIESNTDIIKENRLMVLDVDRKVSSIQVDFENAVDRLTNKLNELNINNQVQHLEIKREIQELKSLIPRAYCVEFDTTYALK